MGTDDNKRIITLIVIAVILYSFFTGIGEDGDELDGGGGETIIV